MISTLKDKEFGLPIINSKISAHLSPDFRCPILEFPTPNDLDPLIVIDPTSFPMANVASKSDLATVAFRQFATLFDKLLDVKKDPGKYEEVDPRVLFPSLVIEGQQ